MDTDITPIMSPERIVGILIWEVMHGRLDEELFALVDLIPDEYPKNLEGDLDNLVKATWGANHDPIVRGSLLSFLRREIEETLKMLS